MKNIKNTPTSPTNSTEQAFASLETASLDGVTGGCAACGSNCAAGPAPAAQSGGTGVNPFDAFRQR